jgi:hypothetical protein
MNCAPTERTGLKTRHYNRSFAARPKRVVLHAGELPRLRGSGCFCYDAQPSWAGLTSGAPTALALTVRT